MAATNATLYFLDGKTLPVQETLAQVEAMLSNGASLGPRWVVHVTDNAGNKVWANLMQVCRMEPK